MSRVIVRLFARARDLAGTPTFPLELPAGATVSDLRRQLAAARPALAGLLQRCAVAVNGDFAGEGVLVTDGAEVAILPPVSGGA